MKDKKAISIKTLNKSNVWDIQENDVIRMWEAAEKDADFKENLRHFKDIIKTAFEIEDVKIDKPVVIDKLEQRGFKVGTISFDDKNSHKIAIKKRAIKRVTDLTYENVGHISATKLVEVLERNFGGGWESLPQSIQDIIESAFDISTTTLPAGRADKKPSFKRPSRALSLGTMVKISSASRRASAGEAAMVPPSAWRCWAGAGSRWTAVVTR